MPTPAARVRRRSDGKWLDPTGTAPNWVADAPAAVPTVDGSAVFANKPLLLLLPFPTPADEVDILLSDAAGNLVGSAQPGPAGKPVVVLFGGVLAGGTIGG